MGLSINEFLIEIRVSTCFNQLHTWGIWRKPKWAHTKELTPPNKTTLQALVEHGQGKNEGTSKFDKNRNRSLPVASAKPFLRNIRWTTGQHIVIIWGCPVSCGETRFRQLCFHDMDQGYGSFNHHSIKVWIPGAQGLDPLHFDHPVVEKPSYRMLQRHEIVIRSHIFLFFPRFLAIPWPLGPPTGGQLAHGIVQLRFIKADLQKKQAGQLGRL